MIRFLLQLALLICSIFLLSFQGITKAQDDDNLTFKLYEYFKALTNLNEFNGTVLIEKNEKVLLHKAYNLEAATAPSLRVTKTTQFGLHSIAKLFGKALVVQLAKEGKINTDDTINKYLSDFPSGDKITIQHLLDNSSGLPREFSDKTINKHNLKPKEVVQFIKKESLEFEPGTATRYSNLGFQLLYFIISKIEGKPYPQVVKNRLFKPLGMSCSGARFLIDNTKNLKEFATSHEYDDETEKIKPVPNFLKEGFKQNKFYATAKDLVPFLNLVKEESYSSKIQNSKGKIGWIGGDDGARAYVQVDVNKQYKIIFLTNYDEIPITQIIKDIEAILEGKPYEVPKAINRIEVPVAVSKLKNYIGTYDFVEADHLLLDIRLENKELVLYQNKEKLIGLQAENDSTFFADPKSKESFIFRKNEAYQVTMDWMGVRLKGYKKD